MLDERALITAKEAGAEVHRVGKLGTSNPAHRPAQLPAVTGEPFTEWHARSRAWLEGWDEEARGQVLDLEMGLQAGQIVERLLDGARAQRGLRSGGKAARARRTCLQ